MVAMVVVFGNVVGSVVRHLKMISVLADTGNVGEVRLVEDQMKIN